MGSDLDSISESQRQRVLIVDDDSDFVEMTKLILCKAGYDVAGALDGSAALEKCSEVNPDLILLDLMMPEMDGFEVFQHIKKVTTAPVIVVTANGDRENVARSLQAGMEDYISKPFYNSEMIARIQAVLKRSRGHEREDMQVFPDIGLLINFNTHEVYLGEKFIWFVPREFAVLSILAHQAPRPVKYAVLMQAVWGEETARNKTHLKNIIFRIRNKLEVDPGEPRIVINYRSMGYQLNVQPEEENPLDAVLSEEPNNSKE